MQEAITTEILSRASAFPPDEALFQALRLCAQAGFRELDLHLGAQAREGYPLAGSQWEAWVEKTALEAEKLGIRFSQAHAFTYKTRESTSDLIDRPWYEERIRRSILAAGRLNVRWLVIHPSDFDADPEYDADKARRYNLDYWPPFVELAAKAGVGVAFENLYASGRHQRYCSRADELIDFVDALGGDNVGVCWDTGHAAVALQNQGESLLMIGARLRALHVHDNHQQPKGDEHLIPYFGTINWDEILSSIANTGYDRVLSLEIKQGSQLLPGALTAPMLRFLNEMGKTLVSRVRDFKTEV